MSAQVSSEVRVAVLRLARRLRSQRADTGLSIAFISALGTVERHGPITPGELAEREKVKPPSMTKILATLESEGYIERTAHPSDGRQSLIRVSPLGKEMLNDDRRRRDAWLSQRLAGLELHERETLREAAKIMERLASS